MRDDLTLRLRDEGGTTARQKAEGRRRKADPLSLRQKADLHDPRQSYYFSFSLFCLALLMSETKIEMSSSVSLRRS